VPPEAPLHSQARYQVAGALDSVGQLAGVVASKPAFAFVSRGFCE
jgi:hypothetical protein